MNVRFLQGLPNGIDSRDRHQDRGCLGNDRFVLARRLEGKRPAPVRFHQNNIHIRPRAERRNQFRRCAEDPPLAVRRPDHEAVPVLIQARSQKGNLFEQ